MAEIDNFEIWRRVRQAWTDNDRVTLEQFVAPDMVITEPDSLPYSGEFRGVDGYQRLFQQISEEWTDLKIEQGDVIGEAKGNAIAIEYFTTARSRRTGKQIVRQRSLALWRFKDGKVVEMRPFNFDTAELTQAMTKD